VSLTLAGIPFTRGSLAYLLRNRFYIGQVVHHGDVCLGQHTPILSVSCSKQSSSSLPPNIAA